jgi:hypothetical protein
MRRGSVWAIAWALVAAGCAGAGAAGKPAEPKREAPAASSSPAQGAQDAKAGKDAKDAPAAERERDAFPLPAALDRLAQAPRPAKIFPEGEGDPEAFDVQDLPAQLPRQVEHRPAGPWEELLAKEAARSDGAVRATEPMACLAEQVGRFFLARDVLPGPAAYSFLASRCGVADAGFGSAYVVQPLGGDEKDAELFEHMRPAVQSQLEKALRQGQTGRQTAGLWFGRDPKRAVAMLVHLRPMAKLDAFPSRGPDGRLTLSGELLRPAVRLHALLTRGRHGFRVCEVDRTVALPRFQVRCELDPADASATLEVAAFEPDRIFGPVVVSARVWPRGDAPRRFVLPSLRARAETDADLAATLVTLLNRVRAEAGLAPVSLVRDQSQTSAALAPRFFGAALEGDDAAMETIVLGLRAGWQVPGLVRTGHFTAAHSDDLGDPGRLLAIALERPSAREALLDPEVRAVAVGTVKEPKAVGALFSTYALVEPAQAAAESEAVLRRLDRERGKRGRIATRPLPELWRETAETAAAVERGDKKPKDAVHDLLEAAKGTLRGGYVRTWIGFGERLDEVELPAALLDPEELRVAVAVSHWRAEGSPWVRYCVIAVALDRSAQRKEAGKKE